MTAVGHKSRQPDATTIYLLRDIMIVYVYIKIIILETKHSCDCGNGFD